MYTDDENKPQEAPIQNARYIRCPDCGEEIMMVPVLSQMIESIENHLATHKDQPEHLKLNSGIPRPRIPNIEETLAEQVLTRAAEISDALGKNSIWINQQ
jgi:hypothetical protein